MTNDRPSDPPASLPASDLTRLAVEWLRKEHPRAVVIEELSVADWGGARIDVAAVTPDKLVGVEIKGAGDSPTRLPLQGAIYAMVASEMWLLPSPCSAARCKKHKPAGWAMLEVHADAIRPANVAAKLGPPQPTERDGHARRVIPDPDRYEPDTIPARYEPHWCPKLICGTLWRDELYDIARLHGVVCGGRARVAELSAALVDTLPVTVLHREMLQQLYARNWRRHRVRGVHDFRRETL